MKTNDVANGSGVASITSGLAGFAEFYPLISLTISFLTFLVFLVFKCLHYRLERDRMPPPPAAGVEASSGSE